MLTSGRERWHKGSDVRRSGLFDWNRAEEAGLPLDADPFPTAVLAVFITGALSNEILTAKRR
jgi:hypothetical protein